MMYVTDTHSFVWFLTQNSSLSKKAREIFKSVELGKDTIIIPIIVLLEILYICEKKKVGLEFDRVKEKLYSSKNYFVLELDFETLLEVENLKKLGSLHDRCIVAVAKTRNFPLISKDEEIKNSGYVEVIW